MVLEVISYAILYATLQQQPDRSKINPPSINQPIQQKCETEIKHSDIYSSLDEEVRKYLKCGDSMLKEKPDSARVVYDTAFEIIKSELPNYNPNSLILSKIWPAESFCHRGDYEESIERYKEANKLIEELERSGYANIIDKRARLQIHLGMARSMVKNIDNVEIERRIHYKYQIVSILDALKTLLDELKMPNSFYSEEAEKILEELKIQ